MGLPAAARAVSLISDSVASMTPLQVVTSAGYISEQTPPLLQRPNVLYGAHEFMAMVVAEVLVNGNLLAIGVDPDPAGWPQQVAPIPWGQWLAEYTSEGFLVYRVGGLTFTPDEVLHVRRNVTPASPYGIGVVAQHIRALGASLDSQALAADTFRSGSIPAGILNLPLPEISQEQADATVSQWLEDHSGGRAPALLPQGWEFKPLQWNPEEADFLASRAMDVALVAMMFGLDPSDLGAALPNGGSLTYANRQDRVQERIASSYGPLARRIEDAFSDLIPGTARAAFNPENLLRTDAKSRVEIEAAEIAAGIKTLEEVRRARGLRPVADLAAPEPVPAPDEVPA